VALIRCTHRMCALIYQILEHGACVEWRAPNEEIICRVSPSLAHPLRIGLKTTAGDDDSLRHDGVLTIL